ncbi:MAG: lmo0937 family membrane protein [Sphingobacteriales bacterium]|nr:lmo0937 family membrane protein [Sphingobacteriales bacterium]
MRAVLNVLTLIFIVGWFLGVFVFKASFLIHILLVLAIFAFIINFLTEPV